eukprot:2384734-Prymnesium_polylepis.1
MAAVGETDVSNSSSTNRQSTSNRIPQQTGGPERMRHRRRRGPDDRRVAGIGQRSEIEQRERAVGA